MHPASTAFISYHACSYRREIGISMHLLAILALGISSNLDTLGVGLAYGCRKMRLPFLSNLICALIPSIGTYITMMLGEAVRYIVSAPLANILGAAILMAAGVLMIIQSLRRQPPAEPQPGTAPCAGVAGYQPSRPRNMKSFGRLLDNPAQVDYDYSGSIDTREATVLALALTLNNLSCGFAAGLMGLNAILTPTAALVISLIFFAAGIKIGHRFISRWFGEKSDLAAGLLLILIGVYEILA